MVVEIMCYIMINGDDYSEVFLAFFAMKETCLPQ